jgi:hypothetical protein
MAKATTRVKRSAPAADVVEASADAKAELRNNQKKVKTKKKRVSTADEALLLPRGAVALFYSKSKNSDDLGECALLLEGCPTITVPLVENFPKRWCRS